MSLLHSIIWIIICFLLSYYLTKYAIRYLGSKALLDNPNDRSSHSIPTPIGGGLAVIFSFAIGCLPLIYVAPGIMPAVGYFFIATGTLVAISFRDDIKSVSISIRLFIHIAAAIIASYAIGIYGRIFHGLIPKEIEFIFMVIAIVTAMNLFNFMDGIDGLTGSQTIFLSLSMGLIFYYAKVETNYIYITSILAASTAGFLYFNWQPAKIFIGDTGSITLGFLIAVLLLIMAAKGYLVQAIILPLYYIADAGFILIRRIFRGEKFWQPHMQHFFQQAVIKGCSHSEVVIKIQIINMLLLVIALLALESHNNLVASLLALLSALMIVMIGIYILPIKMPLLDVRRRV